MLKFSEVQSGVMLSLWCIAHMNPSMWINWAEAWLVSVNRLSVFPTCPPLSTPQMEFHFNWQLAGSIHQSDKLMRGGWVFREVGLLWRNTEDAARKLGRWRRFISVYRVRHRLSQVFADGSILFMGPARAEHPPIPWSGVLCETSGLCLADLLLPLSLFSLSFPDTQFWHILSAAPVGK